MTVVGNIMAIFGSSMTVYGSLSWFKRFKDEMLIFYVNFNMGLRFRRPYIEIERIVSSEKSRSHFLDLECLLLSQLYVFSRMGRRCAEYMNVTRRRIQTLKPTCRTCV